ncbi:GntR family transcriptional regulator [Serratia quinivorans]|uniref:GntR family transcriptional regulator n=1 Tax=Serratia quinivorans TaxID=137545 RepID=UPI0021BD7166|nr:GntR family transcriptional regulator [Serratia quinivorans]
MRSVMSRLLLDREKPVKMQIYHWLKERIIYGEFAPGMILEKNELAHQLNVSPTPLREALILLKHDNFIDMVPNLHTRVKLIEVKRVEENAFIRAALEGAVVEQLALSGISKTVEKACQKLIDSQLGAFDKQDYASVFRFDLEFHHRLVDQLALDSLWDNLYANRAHLDRARQCSPVNVAGIRRSIEQHQQLLQLIVSGQVQPARELIKAHVWSVFDDLKQIVPEYLSRDH